MTEVMTSFTNPGILGIIALITITSFTSFMTK